jgi:hypothetical protein
MLHFYFLGAYCVTVHEIFHISLCQFTGTPKEHSLGQPPCPTDDTGSLTQNRKSEEKGKHKARPFT